MASSISKIHGQRGNNPYPNLGYGRRKNPIEIEDDEVPRHKTPTSRNMKEFSNLPIELQLKIMFSISDLQTLFHVSLLSKDFQALFYDQQWPLVLSAYIKEARHGQHALAINTIISRINEYPISTSKLIECYWKGLCTARRRKDAVQFLVELDLQLLHQESYNNHYEVAKPLQTICQGALVDRSWDAWAAAFTAANFLEEEFGSKMRQWVRNLVAVGWRDIVGQTDFTCQWKDVYFVSEQLQIFLRNSDDDLVEVLKATLDLAVQEKEWQDASCLASKLIELNANPRQVVHILKIIFDHAISEDRWSDAKGTLNVLGTIPDDSNVGEELMSTLQNMWDQISPQAFQNQWDFTLKLGKHLARQLKIRNRNSEVEHILQTLWDEAVRRNDWDSATLATKEIVPLQGEQTIPMLQKAWHEESSKRRWENAFAVAWNIVYNDSNGAVRMLETMWDIAIRIGRWTVAFSSASQLLHRQSMSYDEVVVMLQAIWDSAVYYKGPDSNDELADLGGELKNMIGDLDSGWEERMRERKWGAAFSIGHHIPILSTRMKTGTCTELLLWTIQHHVGRERQLVRKQYLRNLSAKWGLAKFSKLPQTE